MSRLGQRAQHGVRVKDWGRHQFARFAAGIAEHHTLVAGALVLVARGVDTLGDIGRLPMDVALDRRPLPVKVFLLVADVANCLARHFDQLFVGDRGGAADFTGKDDTIGRDQGLDAAAGLRLNGEIGVDDRVGDAVANLVGMAFRHRLAGKHEIAFGQRFALPERSRG